MKFRKTIAINDPGVIEALASGALKLQRGQWVQCDLRNDRKARYVGQLGGGSVWVCHWQGSPEATRAHFATCVEAMRKR